MPKSDSINRLIPLSVIPLSGAHCIKFLFQFLFLDFCLICNFFVTVSIYLIKLEDFVNWFQINEPVRFFKFGPPRSSFNIYQIEFWSIELTNCMISFVVKQLVTFNKLHSFKFV